MPTMVVVRSVYKMTDKEILQKVVQIARKNGFKLNSLWCLDNNETWFDYKEKIIFSHDFAKAFWGIGDVDDQGRTIDEGWEKEFKDSGLFMDKEDYEYSGEWKIAYHYHLKQMVMCSEPIKYLEKFL